MTSKHATKKDCLCVDCVKFYIALGKSRAFKSALRKYDIIGYIPRDLEAYGKWLKEKIQNE